MLPAGQETAEAFYRVVDAAYERRSVAVTSNIHPSGFDQIMPKTLATATVDRLLHHAHLPVADHTRDRGHGRVGLRRLQVTTVAGLDFPTPPRRSASPDASGRIPAAAGGP